MHLTPTETARLTTFSAAALAREARARGLRLSAPEAIALVCDEVHWAVRAGCTYDEAVALGGRVLDRDDVLPGVTGLVDEIRVEPVFEEGTRLVVLRWPLGRPTGRGPEGPGPGSVLPSGDDVPAVVGERRQMRVTNTSTRVVRVSSHYPLHLVNRRLELDREAATGFRLDLPAGDFLRWGPGDSLMVGLVRLPAARSVDQGGPGLVDPASTLDRP